MLKLKQDHEKFWQLFYRKHWILFLNTPLKLEQIKWILCVFGLQVSETVFIETEHHFDFLIYTLDLCKYSPEILNHVFQQRNQITHERNK